MTALLDLVAALAAVALIAGVVTWLVREIQRDGLALSAGTAGHRGLVGARTAVAPVRHLTMELPPVGQVWDHPRTCHEWPLTPSLGPCDIPFQPSERSSLGIEWELELVDLDTRELTSGASEILAEITPVPGEEHPKAKHELLESTVEVITGICSTVAEAREDLGGTVKEVQAAAAKRNLGVMCSGTHPFTDWSTQSISPNERYAQLVEQMQWLARRLQIFGVHVHVGVRAPEKAIPINNALMMYIPHFLALSASSPFWIGF